jgi:hypothetical protein
MSQKRTRLLKQFAEISRKRIPGFSFRRSKSYYDSLTPGDKARFSEEMERFISGRKVREI